VLVLYFAPAAAWTAVALLFALAFVNLLPRDDGEE
jgi:hypothetical protein